MLYHTDLPNEEAKINYVEALIDAFEQIDVNGDETLEWDEFSNFIVETGIARQKKNYLDVIRNYHLSTVTKDKVKHESSINRVFFIQELKQLFVLESFSKKIKIYNYLNGNLLYNFEAHNASVLYVEYISSYKIIVSSGADNCLKFWNPMKNYSLINKIATRELQLIMKWIPSQMILITAGFDTVINCYKKIAFEESGKFRTSIELVSLKKHHYETITDILVIESQNLIIASDLEGLITFWKLASLEIKNELRSHLKGVLSLSYIEGKNILLSAGYEHEIFLWDIIVGKRIAVLQGHSQSLIGVTVFPKTYQIISGDVSGIFKLWDYRSMSLVQTFSIPTTLNKKANCFCITQFHKKRIIVGADKLYFYDYEESREGSLADSKSCICVLYNDVFNCFITGHLDSIKIWSAENGTLKQVFRDITSAEISSISLDKRKRKLFIGDVDGNLCLVNILNGVQMKTFSKHLDYVSSMTYYNSGKKFISAGWDGVIKIHDDDSPEEKGQLLSEFGNSLMNKVNSCNSIDFSEKLNILAAGFDNGIVTLINMKSSSSEGFLTDHKKVRLITFLDTYHSIIVCDNSGSAYFWTLIPTKPKKLTRDFHILNTSLNENNKIEPYPVKCLCFEPSRNIIVIGDETGLLKAYSISEYIKYLQIIDSQTNITYTETKNLFSDLTEVNTGSVKYNSLEKVLKLRDSMNLTPSLIKSWKGHKLGVTSICCNSNPIFYSSSGQDCKVHIWNENFEIIGSLTTIKDPGYNLKIDIENQRKKKRELTLKEYNNVQMFTYESLFDDSSEAKLQILIVFLFI